MAEQGHQYLSAGGKAAKNKSQEYLHIGNAQEGLPSSSHQIERYRDTAYGGEGTLVPPDTYAQEVLAALQMGVGVGHPLSDIFASGGWCTDCYGNTWTCVSTPWEAGAWWSWYESPFNYVSH